MVHVITIILAFLVSAGVAFAAAFTVITIHVARQRRVAPKYHFLGTADVSESARKVNLDYPSSVSSVDEGSAKRSWDEKD